MYGVYLTTDGYTARTDRRERNAYRVSVEKKPEEINNLEELGADWRIILKCLKAMACVGVVRIHRFRIGRNVGLFVNTVMIIQVP